MNKGEVPPASEWGGHRRGGGGGQGPLGLQAGALPPDHTGGPPPGPAALLKRPAQEDPKPHCWGTLLRTLWAPALPGPGSFREAPPSWARGPAPTHLFLVASRFRSPLRRSPALDPDRPPGQPSCLRAGFLEAAALPHWSGSPWGHSLLGSPTIHVWKDCAQCPVCPNDQACQGRRDQPDAQPGPGGDPCAHCCVSRGTW